MLYAEIEKRLSGLDLWDFELLCAGSRLDLVFVPPIASMMPKSRLIVEGIVALSVLRQTTVARPSYVVVSCSLSELTPEDLAKCARADLAYCYSSGELERALGRRQLLILRVDGDLWLECVALHAKLQNDS